MPCLKTGGENRGGAILQSPRWSQTTGGKDRRAQMRKEGWLEDGRKHAGKPSMYAEYLMILNDPLL